MLKYCPMTLRNIRKEVVGIDTKVPLSNGKFTNYINFDNAATHHAKTGSRKVNEFANWPPVAPG